jgi:hypothetical protein
MANHDLYANWMSPVNLSLERLNYFGEIDLRSGGSFDWNVTDINDDSVIERGNTATANDAKQHVWDCIEKLVNVALAER